MKAIWRTNPYGPMFWPSENAREAEKDLGITRIYYPTLRKRPDTGKYVFNELQMNPKFARDLSTRFEFAPYYDVSWDSETSGKAMAQKMDSIFRDVGNCKAAMWDIEYHYCNDTIIELITEWRKIRPSGPIAWTMEPFQAGWMSKKLIDKVNNDINMVVVVQDFFGGMQPAGTRNGLTPAQELLKLGYKQNRIKIFYNGALVNTWKSFWDGCILGEETLPTYST